jgi:hypothetical protein
MKRIDLQTLRREHRVFFWGTSALTALLLVGIVTVALWIPSYRAEAAEIDLRMTETERETRDRILDSRARRSELAVALLQRELRLKALEEKRLHLAIDTEEEVLYLRHGPATLRSIPVSVGADSTIRAPDGRAWRLVQPLGERHVVLKEESPSYTVPEWVYVSRGETVPPERERSVSGALGRYVLHLDDGTLIYTEPRAGPFAGSVAPAAFMVPEREMRAVFEALRKDTPVYIY